MQAFFQGAVAGGEVAEALLEGGVLGSRPLGGVAVVVVLVSRSWPSSSPIRARWELTRMDQQHERVVLTRNGRPAAVLVSLARSLAGHGGG